MALTVIEKPRDLAVDVIDRGITDDEAVVGAKAVVNLFRFWGLTDSEACTLLGGISSATYTRWKRGEIGRLAVDLKTRLSIILGIHKALRILYTENTRAYGWVKRENSDFGELRPLDVMLNGQMSDLEDIRNYLDAARG